jgi:hypothetical protein
LADVRYKFSMTSGYSQQRRGDETEETPEKR